MQADLNKADLDCQPKSACPTTVERRRIWAVHSLLIIILSGFAYILITNSDFFPFSRYSMFSRPYVPGPWSALRLSGIRAVGGGEFAIEQTKYIQPFKWTRLEGAIQHMLSKPNPGPQLAEAVRDCFFRYEALRAEGAHNGPPLVGMKLYRVIWDQVDTDKPPSEDRISRREVLAEFNLFQKGPEK